MKVVLDTNVLVSGILFTGPPHQILLAWSDGRFELVFSADIHEEYRRVVSELQRQFPRVDFEAALDLVLVNAHADIFSFGLLLYELLTGHSTASRGPTRLLPCCATPSRRSWPARPGSRLAPCQRYSGC
jgi:hypothetical protein